MYDFSQSWVIFSLLSAFFQATRIAVTKQLSYSLSAAAMTFFINFIKAIHDNSDLLRASIASAGNDHRLGANEAPPAIISIFTGTLLEQVLKEFKSKHC